MPDPNLITPRGWAMLGELPPVLRGSVSYQAVIHCYAREFDRIEATLEQLRAQFNPATADILLAAWEIQVRLPAGGQPGATLETRRTAVLARLRKLLGDSDGLSWVATITGIVGPVWSYQEHDPADATSPPDGVIRITLPSASGTPEWTQATQQIRDVTAAHLELEFISTSVFQLDISELDVQDLGE